MDGGKLNADAFLKLKEVLHRSDDSRIIWRGVGYFSVIRFYELCQLVNNESINDSVIDSWGELLLHRMDKVGVLHSTTIFSSRLLGCLDVPQQSNDAYLRKNLVQKMNEHYSKSTLLFPVNTKGTVCVNTVADHWTLLKRVNSTGGGSTITPFGLDQREPTTT